MNQPTGNQPPSPPAQNPPLSPTPGFVGGGFKAAGFKPSSPDSPVSPPAAETKAPPQSSDQASAPSVAVVASKGNGKGPGAKTIALVIFLVLLLAGLVAGFGKIRSFISSAQGSCEPEAVSESNLTANSVEIVFRTGKACKTEVAYGTSKQALLLKVPEAMASLNHRIRLTPLLASTTYYYQIESEDKKLGEVRSFLTKPPAATPVPTAAPTAIPTQSTASPSAGLYTLEDFQAQFGSDSAEFDVDKNGVVNMRDWLMYQKED
ncbi:MAG TPA: fibronectin type III domain-containing protein [Clostridia bacterium]|nr:fibronectin type III domain-containing protein [Clostridia bacterium]